MHQENKGRKFVSASQNIALKELEFKDRVQNVGKKKLFDTFYVYE